MKQLFSHLAVLTMSVAAWGQGTAFTYQGHLNDGTSPANGIYDFRFAVCDALTNGNYVSGPLTNLATPVSNGLFGVTLDFGAGVFTGENLWLELAVCTNGGNAFATLAPRQQIAATPYATFAGVAAVANTATVASSVAAGSITSASLASNSVTAAQLAAGAAAANFGASGGLILSSTDNPALLNSGFSKLGTMLEQGGDTWKQLASATAFRTGQSGVWSGSEMIIWGGGFPSDGARFNPALNTWSNVSSTNSPSSRSWHTAIWTGTEMIVWGGRDQGGSYYFNDGARYNPFTDTWTAINVSNAPTGRINHTAVWTGAEMLIWGGVTNSSTWECCNEGACYNPTTDTWRTINSTNAPAARASHTAVWTGTEMIVWGGWTNSGVLGVLGDGARYDPTTDIWTPVSNVGAPIPRESHTAVWTGNQMIIWGGQTNGYSYSVLNDGAYYNPVSNIWSSVSMIDAPEARCIHTAIWTGTEMLIWAGLGKGITWNNGGRYNPSANSWTSMSTSAAPIGRYYNSTVWTGSKMLMCGGYNAASLADCWSYTPGKVMVLYQKQ